MAVMLRPQLLRPLFECHCPGKVCRCGAHETGEDIDPAELGDYPRAFWIDPGTHTGWACVWFDPDVLFDEASKPSKAVLAWWCGMVVGEENSQVDYLMAKLRIQGVGGEGLACGTESFVVHSIKKEKTFLSPVRIAASFKWALHRGQKEPDGVFRRRPILFEQAPVDAKTTITDDRLKLWQMWLPGAEHPRDATRHCLLWLRRLKSVGEEFYDQAHFVDEEEEDD